MTSMTYRTRGRSIRRVPGDALSGVKRRPHRFRTTAIDRLLLVVMAAIIPLGPFLPTFAEFSTEYIMFAILVGYTLLNRPGAVARTWGHPVFLAAFILLIMAGLIESVHPFARYGGIFRMGLMFVAAIFVASLCRDRRALRASIYGYLIGGVLISVILFLTVYGALRGATATDFSEATKVRSEVFEEVDANPNTLAKFAGQGAVIALALGLTARSPRRRNLFFGLTLFCIVASSLSMSRAGMVAVGVACATVMFAYGVRNVRVILVATALAVGTLIWIPEAVFSRLSFSTETSSGKMEARARIYKAAIDHLPEYVLTGVGAGNFQGPWGMRTDFYLGRGRTVVHGAHNTFIQVTIFWGVAGLLAFILVIYLAYCCLPTGGGKDVLVLCLYGIGVSVLLQMMSGHGLANKEYSLVLGMLVGGQRWIWPKGIIRSFRWRERRRDSAFEHAR
jgi:O-Antigen ligase